MSNKILAKRTIERRRHWIEELAPVSYTHLAMVEDAVACYFDETMEAPKMIRLHFVREEILAA